MSDIEKVKQLRKSTGAGFKDWLGTPRVWLNVSKPVGQAQKKSGSEKT